MFPLNGKLPFGGTHAFKDATLDPKQIRAWWKKWPNANVGIACDSQTGPIVVDIDGPSGWAMIEDLAIVDTRQATSGKKTKRHLYFDPLLDGTEIRRMIRPFGPKGGKIALDILGDGGYVVAPPSVHPETGRRYQWVSKRPMTRLPKVLLRMLNEQQQEPNGKKSIADPLPDTIGEGERDNLLTSLAGSMRRRNASPSAILAALREENERRVDPPLPDKDLRRIAKSIGSKEPAETLEHFTDLGNARRFIRQHGEQVRSVMTSRRPWLLWDDTRWVADVTGEVDRMAKQTVRRIYAEAQRVDDDEQRDAILKHAAYSESASRIRSMMELAATEPELSTTTSMLDANPWAFNVMNGTVDLKTCKLRPANPDDLITKLATVEYKKTATAPRWDMFLREIMDNDMELVRFLQTAVGYTLTGDTREQCLFFCHGRGSNGKTTFFEILRLLFGEYAKQSDFNTFVANKGDGPRNDIARMQGARLVTASESDAERGFDGKVVKSLTGDDTVVARRLYEEFMEFKPAHKLWLMSNHKPIVKEQTEGFWRRIRLIPFTVNIPKAQRDKRLKFVLKKELSGVLNWALEGCQRWRADGLIEPAAVKRATRDYKDENDVLGEFLDQSCRLDPDAWASTPQLYRAFTDWWQATRGSRSAPLGMAWFGRLLGERSDLKPVKTRHGRGWRGVVVTAVSKGDLLS